MFGYNLKLKDFNRQNISFGLFRVSKAARQKLGIDHYEGQKTVVYLLGIQRSGTSLMYWVMERDYAVKIYRESSELTSQDTVEGVRLNSLSEVKARIDKDQSAIVVLKPLVESQRAHELLALFPDTKAVWNYRHYLDVAASNLTAFGADNGVKDLRPFVDDDPDNWRSQNSLSETRETIRRFFREDMDNMDAAALFWWARCRLYFDLGLDKNPSVLLNRYEDVATNPAGAMRRIYNFIGHPYPGDGVVRDVHPRSVGKGRVSTLSPDVEALCADLLARLDEHSARQAQALEGLSAVAA